MGLSSPPVGHPMKDCSPGNPGYAVNVSTLTCNSVLVVDCCGPKCAVHQDSTNRYMRKSINRAPKDWQLWSLGDVPGFSNVLGLFQVIMAKLEMGIFSAKLLKNQGEIGFQSGMNLEGVTFETYSTTCDFFIEDLDMICQFFQKFLVLSEDLTVSI